MIVYMELRPGDKMFYTDIASNLIYINCLEDTQFCRGLIHQAHLMLKLRKHSLNPFSSFVGDEFIMDNEL